MERLTWVVRELTLQGCLPTSTDPDAQIDLYDEANLRGLFQQYPTLRYVQWINQYSTHPFNDDPDLTLAEQNIVCRVLRPTDVQIAREEPLPQLRPFEGGV